MASVSSSSSSSPSIAGATPGARFLPSARLLQLPPLPAVASKLLTLLAKPNFTIPEISQLIRSDAAFAVEVLRLANSASLGLRYEVVSIMHGISVLGVDRLRNLVLTVAMRDFLRKGAGDQAALIKACWRHNLATALWAEAMADDCGIEPSDAYSAGLLHDLGRLAIAAAFPKEYAAALQAFGEAGPGAVWSESQYLGLDHREAGLLIADKWGLPSAIRAVLAQTGEPSSAISGFTLPNLVFAASSLADRQGFASVPDAPPWDDAWLKAALPAPAFAALAPSLDGLRESIPTRINLFECEFQF